MKLIDVKVSAEEPNQQSSTVTVIVQSDWTLNVYCGAVVSDDTCTLGVMVISACISVLLSAEQVNDVQL